MIGEGLKRARHSAWLVELLPQYSFVYTCFQFGNSVTSTTGITLTPHLALLNSFYPANPRSHHCAASSYSAPDKSKL